MVLQQVYDFCNQMVARYNAGFTQNHIQNGVKISGEYYVSSGRLFSIVLTVTNMRINSKIYDASRRLIFNDNYSGNILQNKKLLDFINRSVQVN